MLAWLVNLSQLIKTLFWFSSGHCNHTHQPVCESFRPSSLSFCTLVKLISHLCNPIQLQHCAWADVKAWDYANHGWVSLLKDFAILCMRISSQGIWNLRDCPLWIELTVLLCVLTRVLAFSDSQHDPQCGRQLQEGIFDSPINVNVQGPSHMIACLHKWWSFFYTSLITPKDYLDMPANFFLCAAANPSSAWDSQQGASLWCQQRLHSDQSLRHAWRWRCLVHAMCINETWDATHPWLCETFVRVTAFYWQGSDS